MWQRDLVGLSRSKPKTQKGSSGTFYPLSRIPPTYPSHLQPGFPLELPPPPSPGLSLAQGPRCALIPREVIAADICSRDTEWAPLCVSGALGL